MRAGSDRTINQARVKLVGLYLELKQLAFSLAGCAICSGYPLFGAMVVGPLASQHDAKENAERMLRGRVAQP